MTRFLHEYLGAATLGALLAAVHLLPGPITARVVSGDWLISFGFDRTAETLSMLNYLVDAAAFAVGIGGVLVFGYWLGRQIDLASAYRGMLFRVGLGGVLGYVLVCFVVSVYDLVTTGGAGLLSLRTPVLLLFAGRAVGVAIQFPVVALAGGALATFTADR